MQIFVKRANMTNAKTIALEVDPSDLVNDVKDKIEEKVNIPIGKQTLYYNCERLDDYKTLAFYNMSKNSTLQLFGSSEGPPIQTNKDDTEEHQVTGRKTSLSSWETNGCSSERLDNLNIKMQTSFGDVRKQEKVEKIVKEKGKKEAMKEMAEVLNNFRTMRAKYEKTIDQNEHLKVELKHMEAKFENVLDQAEHVKAEHIKANIENIKSANEKELFKMLPLGVMTLNQLVQIEYQDRIKNPIALSKLPAKKTSRKSRMLKKLHDSNVDFKSKKLHEVFKVILKQLKKLHVDKARFLQKDTEEANLLKKENIETMEHLKMVCKNIQSELAENKGVLDLEIKEIIYLEEQWKKLRSMKTSNGYQVPFLTYLEEVQEIIYCQETLMIEKYKCEANRLTTELNNLEAAHENSSEKAARKKKRHFSKCCWFCSEEEGSLLKCSGCKKAYYCNDKCIQQDWSVHGDWCSRRRIKREERKGKK